VPRRRWRQIPSSAIRLLFDPVVQPGRYRVAIRLCGPAVRLELHLAAVGVPVRRPGRVERSIVHRHVCDHLAFRLLGAAVLTETADADSDEQ